MFFERHGYSIQHLDLLLSFSKYFLLTPPGKNHRNLGAIGKPDRPKRHPIAIVIQQFVSDLKSWDVLGGQRAYSCVFHLKKLQYHPNVDFQTS